MRVAGLGCGSLLRTVFVLNATLFDEHRLRKINSGLNVGLDGWKGRQMGTSGAQNTTSPLVVQCTLLLSEKVEKRSKMEAGKGFV